MCGRKCMDISLKDAAAASWKADVILMQTFATIYRPFMKWLTLLFIFTSSWNNQLSKTQLQESPILLKQDSKTPSVARSTN